MSHYQNIPDKMVIYDGHCVICNGSVHWIARHDRSGKIRFTHSETSVAGSLSPKLPQGVNTRLSVVFWDEGNLYVFSNAVIQIAKDLRSPYNLLRFYKILPQSFRDGLYRFIATNRFRLFKRSDQCILPDDRLRSKIIL